MRKQLSRETHYARVRSGSLPLYTYLRSQMRSLYCTVTFLTYASFLLAQAPLEDEGLRSLVDGPGGASALTGGVNRVYVKNQANGIPEDILYDFPQGEQATLVHASGKSYAARARYHRELGKVEIWYGGGAYFVDGEIFPYVQIGPTVYAYNAFGTGKQPSYGYGRLVAGSSETDFQVLRTYALTRKSSTPSSSAFSQRDAPAYRLDSADVVIGVRPVAIEVRKRRSFQSKLTPCASDAHEAALRRERFRSVAYYEALVRLLQRDCPREESRGGR